MASIGDTTRPAFAYDQATDTWVPVGVGPHSHTASGVGAVATSSFAAKGDLVAGTGAGTLSNLSVGTNGQSLVADSTTATGLKWATAGASVATPTSSGTVFGVTNSASPRQVGIGYNACASITSGNENVGVGYNALTTNNTGGYNVAVGSSALFSNTTGTTNVAVGYSALSFNTTGGTNTAVGNSALATNIIGSENTAVGSQALATSTGDGNTAVGTGAANANTTGTNNTAVGLYALGNATGSYNVALGYYAAAYSGNVSGITAVGNQALGAVTGANNTAIGNNTGYNVTSGTNNTLVGYNAQPSSSTASNVITLGNASIATLRCQVTSITALSDERDKKNIEPLNVGLDFINTLKPVTFDWNMRPTTDKDGNEIAGGKVDIPDAGFIAQDIIAAEDATGAADHLQLSYRDNPDALEITQGRLIPVLVKAIQDLSANNAALLARIEALEGAN